MSTELSTPKRICKITAFKPKSSKSIAFLVAGVLLLLAIDAAYNIGYGFVYGLGLLLTVLTFTLTLIIDNFFLLLEADWNQQISNTTKIAWYFTPQRTNDTF